MGIAKTKQNIPIRIWNKYWSELFEYCTNCPFYKGISSKDSKFCDSLLSSLIKYFILSIKTLKAPIKTKKNRPINNSK